MMLKGKDLKALIIQSAKKDIFIAGADIKEIENITEEADGKAKAQAGQRVMDKIEDLAFSDGGGDRWGRLWAADVNWPWLAVTGYMTFNDKIRIGLAGSQFGFCAGIWRDLSPAAFARASAGIENDRIGKPHQFFSGIQVRFGRQALSFA